MRGHFVRSLCVTMCVVAVSCCLCGCQPPGSRLLFQTDSGFVEYFKTLSADGRVELKLIGGGGFDFIRDDEYGMSVSVEVKAKSKKDSLFFDPNRVKAFFESMEMTLAGKYADPSDWKSNRKKKMIISYQIEQPRFDTLSWVHENRPVAGIHLDFGNTIECNGVPVEFDTIVAIDRTADRYLSELRRPRSD